MSVEIKNENEVPKINEVQKSNDFKINLNRPYVVRLNGYSFLKFRDSFHKPYDPTLQYALVLTANDLLLGFKARTAHTNAFQILLLFDGQPELTTDGRPLSNSPEKLLTMYSSFATVRFNHHIVEQMMNEHYIGTYLPSQVAKVMTKQAMFYGTYVTDDLTTFLVDQCRDKTLGLAIKLWAFEMLPEDIAKGKTPAELVKLLPVRWTTVVPTFVSFGVFAKLKKSEPHEPKTVELRTFQLQEDSVPMMFREFWDDEFGGDRLTKERFFNVEKRDGDLLLPLG